MEALILEGFEHFYVLNFFFFFFLISRGIFNSWKELDVNSWKEGRLKIPWLRMHLQTKKPKLKETE